MCKCSVFSWMDFAAWCRLMLSCKIRCSVLHSLDPVLLHFARQDVSPEDIPIMLVGNKCDLRGDRANCVPTTYGEKLAMVNENQWLSTCGSVGNRWSWKKREKSLLTITTMSIKLAMQFKRSEHTVTSFICIISKRKYKAELESTWFISPTVRQEIYIDRLIVIN